MVVLSEHPCGCDVERQRRICDSALARVAGEDEMRAFSPIELWTLKESLYKAVGNAPDGDACAFVSKYCFSLTNGELTCAHADVGAIAQCNLGDFQMAVVVLGAERSVVFREVDPGGYSVMEGV